MEEYGDNGTSIGDKSQGYRLGKQFIPMMAATNTTDFKVNINRKSLSKGEPSAGAFYPKVQGATSRRGSKEKPLHTDKAGIPTL